MNGVCTRAFTIALLLTSASAFAQQPDPLTQFTRNACAETNPESATVLRMDPITGKREIFASALRNTIGFDWHPVSGRLYGMGQGMDWLGSNTHRYHFRIFALDTALRLGSGANRHVVLEAAKGHVLAEGVLVGTCRKAP